MPTPIYMLVTLKYTSLGQISILRSIIGNPEVYRTSSVLISSEVLNSTWWDLNSSFEPSILISGAPSPSFPNLKIWASPWVPSSPPTFSSSRSPVSEPLLPRLSFPSVTFFASALQSFSSDSHHFLCHNSLLISHKVPAFPVIICRTSSQSFVLFWQQEMPYFLLGFHKGSYKNPFKFCII